MSFESWGQVLVLGIGVLAFMGLIGLYLAWTADPKIGEVDRQGGDARSPSTSPQHLYLGELKGETRVQVNIEGSLSLLLRDGTEVILDFASLTAHTQFWLEVLAALEWRTHHYFTDLTRDVS